MNSKILQKLPWLFVLVAAGIIGIVAINIGTSNNDRLIENAAQEIEPESPSYIPIDPDDVQKSWAVVGISKADGSDFTEVKDQHIVFDGIDMRFYEKDELVMNYAYRFADEYTIELVNHDNVKDQRVWVLQELKQESGSEITLTDNDADLKYYIELAPDFEDPEEAKKITMDYLDGWWQMTETGKAGAREALADNWMYFADGRMYYYENGIQVTDNSVRLEKQTLVMTTERLGVTLYWVAEKQENGDVLYTDSSGVEYYCTRGDGYSSTNPDGFWEMYAVSVVDGSNYSPLSSCYLVFSGGSCKYYVGGKITTDNTFYWLDDWTINITTQDGTTDEWVIIDRGGGYAVITGKNRMLAYYVRRTAPIDFDPELIGEPVSDEELQGAWNVLSWKLLDGTQYTEPDGWQFVFEDGLIKYYINGVLINTNSYSFTDSTHMRLTTVSSYNGEGVGNSTEWELKINNGIISIKDRNLGLIYQMSKDVTDLGESVDITNDMLQGTWKVVSSDAEGFNSDKNWSFTFKDNNVTFKGDNTYRYTYSLKNNVITADLTGYDFQQTWKLALTKDGKLTIAIGGNYTYVCEKDSADSDKKPEEKPSSITNAELAGTWSGSIGETYTFDGKGACLVDFSPSSYPALGKVSYTYKLDEATGKAVATYAGGEQNWTFIKDAEGKITMEIEETGYSTPLTKVVTPPEDPEDPPEETKGITNEELAGTWSGSIGETYTFDGNGACVVDFTPSSYPTLGKVSYTYTLDEKTGKAVATYAGGEQNWTFTKGTDGIITMAIAETSYSTPLTKVDTPPEDPEDPPEETKVITNAELTGTWSGGLGETYTFDGNGACTVDFTASTYPALGVTDYTYTLDETAGTAVATHSGGTQNWTFTKGSDGTITMAVAETSYSTPLTKVDTPPEDPEDPPEETKVITNAELAGTWEGRFGETYAFDGNGACKVDFTALSGGVIDYTYTLDETTGKAVATFTGGTQNWTFTKGSDGITMAIAETGYTTPLTKVDTPPEDPEDPPEETKVITNAELAGTWSGIYGETYTFDGSGACKVDFTALSGGVIDYTYTLDETTGKAVATYAGGTQNWTFTKGTDGTITMAIAETGYATALTKVQ